MKNPLRNIIGAFVIVAIVPVAFLLYQLSQVNENERIVRESYQNQLDAILYSVNQYSDDVISNWANRVRLEASHQPWEADTIAHFLKAIIQAGVVKSIYMTDTSAHSILINLSGDPVRESLKQNLDQLAKQESEKLSRLIQYQKAGFQKMEAINFPVDPNSIPVFFALDDHSHFVLGALLIDLRAFIVNNLAPKMQLISQDKFVVSALRLKDDSVVYTTDLGTASADIQKAARVFKDQLQKRDFWVLPGYYLGISLKGTTIDDLVSDRTRTTLIILATFLVVLIGGIAFLYRNIRREMQLSQAKSEFVSNVSHEIRTPLSLIGMFAETLETGRVTSEEKKKEYYHIIGKETARLSKIVNRILNFSQMDANRKRFVMNELQLNDLCREILRTYSDHLTEKGFEWTFEEGKLPTVMADRESASEAIINLLDNAIKYSLEHRKVVISTNVNNGFAVVEVRDYGMGIARNHHRAIFDQFFRAPSGDVHTTKGSGLGLTLVKRIMHAHQGDVTVESAPGKGSTFRLLFPLEKEKKS